MKKTIFIVLILLLVIHIDGFGQNRRERLKEKADTVKVDSLEYRLLIFDPGFESWLATQPSENFYSKDYYEQRNRLYVSEWNHRYTTQAKSNLYETYIEYNPNTDYGLDLNYKLYYYFKYFERKNRVTLYPTGRLLN